jgi:spoIIIJ-associated protein
MKTERNSIEITAPTVEDAILIAETEHELPVDELEMEVLTEGLVTEKIPARVRFWLPNNQGVLQIVQECLLGILKRMDLPATLELNLVTAANDNPEVHANITGDSEDLGMLIGRRGETLESLEYLVRAMTAQRLGQPISLSLDVDGYYRRRKVQLERLAQRIAQQVVQQQRSVSLEPMPAKERRIVHMALAAHGQVQTESVGMEPNRKVVVLPVGSSNRGR